jgi:hypothetical protein
MVAQPLRDNQEVRMRGDDQQPEVLFSYIRLEQRVPADQPLRPIREMVDTVLRELSPEFARLYPKVGRPSIPPEKLLRALLLQILYSIPRRAWRTSRGHEAQLAYQGRGDAVRLVVQRARSPHFFEGQRPEDPANRRWPGWSRRHSITLSSWRARTVRDRSPRFVRATLGGRLARRWCRGQRDHQIRFTVRTHCPNTSVAQADGIEDGAARMIRVLYGGGRNRFRHSLRRRILSRPLDGALLRRERHVHEAENDNPAEQPEDNADRQRATVPRREERAVRRPRHIVAGHRRSPSFHLTLNLIDRVRPL